MAFEILQVQSKLCERQHMLFYDVQFSQHEYFTYGVDGHRLGRKYTKVLIVARLDWVCLGEL